MRGKDLWQGPHPTRRADDSPTLLRVRGVANAGPPQYRPRPGAARRRLELLLRARADGEGKSVGGARAELEEQLEADQQRLRDYDQASCQGAQLHAQGKCDPQRLEVGECHGAH